LDSNDETNSDFITIKINDEKNNEHNKVKGKKSKINFEFPYIYKALKSQENLFQDRLDKKFNSLIILKPEVKEQLKTMNRSMVGKKQFLKYLNQTKTMLQNPFYESIKLKEELNNKTMK
jgi:uncharacterized short protein YbdD (DUF466 family)